MSLDLALAPWQIRDYTTSLKQCKKMQCVHLVNPSLGGPGCGIVVILIPELDNESTTLSTC